MKLIPAEFRHNRWPLLGSAIGLACGIKAYTPVSSNFLRHLEREFGWTKTAASAGTTPKLLSSISLAVLVSRLMVASMLDRFPPQRTASLALLVAALGFAVWGGGGVSLGLVLVAALLIATAIGAELNFLSFFFSRHFGVRHYCRIYGCASIFSNLGIALGGLSFGLIRDASGSYESAIVFAGGLLVLASAAFAALGRPAHSAGEVAA